MRRTSPSGPLSAAANRLRERFGAKPRSSPLKERGRLRREGPMSIRRLAQQLGRDYKSVHSETSLLIQTGLIKRTAEDEVRIGWDRVVTELDMAA